MVLERAHAVASNDGMTIWLPLRWPVITLRVLQPKTQELMWDIGHESFHEISEVAEPLEIEITRVSVSPITRGAPPAAIVFDTVPLRYGDPPAGMRQFFPRGCKPPDLEASKSYLIVVRENLDGDLRRFEVSLASPVPY